MIEIRRKGRWLIGKLDKYLRLPIAMSNSDQFFFSGAFFIPAVVVSGIMA
jgi:hypothetical protein